MNQVTGMEYVKVKICIVMVCVVFYGCSSVSSKKPAWINQPHVQYAHERYLSAIGIADDSALAADRSISNLAKIFEVTVSDSLKDVSSAQVSWQDGQSFQENEQRVSRHITTEAKQVIAGAEVVEYWTSESGRVYALAVLDKLAAASRFRQKILRQDQEVKGLVQFASTQSRNPVNALNALNRARSVQIERDQNNENLQVLTEGEGVASQFNAAAVTQLIDQALSELHFSIESENAFIKAGLQQAVATLGISIIENSRYVLYGAMDMTSPQKRQGWFWMQGSYELIFKEKNSVLAKKRWPIKVSATEEGVLLQRVKDAVNDQLTDYVFQLLSDFPE